MTSCASPTSQPTCKDVGADDPKGGCAGGQVCGGGKCVANPCAGQSAGNLVPNAGFDNSIWPLFGNTGNPIGNWNSSDAHECANSGSLQVGTNSDPRVCVTYGSVSTLYAGYMINRSTADGQVGCFVDTWYYGNDCQNTFDLGDVDVLIAPNRTGWQQVSGTITVPAMTKSLLLACHLVSATAPALFDRVYVRTTPGGF
jgi:hypothetical protein